MINSFRIFSEIAAWEKQNPVDQYGTRPLRQTPSAQPIGGAKPVSVLVSVEIGIPCSAVRFCTLMVNFGPPMAIEVLQYGAPACSCLPVGEKQIQVLELVSKMVLR